MVVCSILTCSMFNRLCVQLTFVQMLKVQYDFCSIIQMLSYSTFKLLMFNWPFVQLTSCSVVFWSSRICSIIFLFNCFVQKDLFIRPLFNRPGRRIPNHFIGLSQDGRNLLFLLMLVLFLVILLHKAAVEFFTNFAATFQGLSAFQDNSNPIQSCLCNNFVGIF